MSIRLLFIVVISLCIGSSAFARAEITDFSAFKKIPVIDNGRIKPLDTYARSVLTQFSGRDHVGKQSAIAWFASFIFTPGLKANDKIFLINDPAIAQSLGIMPAKDRRYTPAQMQGSYVVLTRLHDEAVKIPEKERSLADHELIRIYDNVLLYTQLAGAFMAYSDKHMAIAYIRGDNAAFNKATQAYIRSISSMLSKEDRHKMEKFPLELVYHQSSPFTWSIVLYIFAFVFFVISFTSSKSLWYNMALCSIIAGFIPHVLGLVMRIIIMGRPPVSSLYETFIFVALIAVVLSLFIEYYHRQWLGIVTAAISGAALLFIANKYSAEGDTLRVLVAVLNSNFWLATHVTTITMGYAATCVGGVLGHIWLLQAMFKKDSEVLDKTYKITLGVLGLGLTLTFLGTNLGGIWADQSWGRFWGWDPKENGALMIVLWTALLFHAKVGKMIGPRGIAVGAVLGMIVVMWAWFGVNLLNIGLHSYGFTSGIAVSLGIYVLVEIIFLLLVCFYKKM